VMCSEFMRSDLCVDEGMVKIESLAMPVGRTMPGVDIYGVDAEGKRVMAQVTFSEYECIGWKKRALLEYVGDKDVSSIVLFCDVKEPIHEDGILVYPLNRIYELFCKQSDIGSRWLEAIV